MEETKEDSAVATDVSVNHFEDTEFGKDVTDALICLRDAIGKKKTSFFLDDDKSAPGSQVLRLLHIAHNNVGDSSVVTCDEEGNYQCHYLRGSRMADTPFGGVRLQRELLWRLLSKCGPLFAARIFKTGDTVTLTREWKEPGIFFGSAKKSETKLCEVSGLYFDMRRQKLEFYLNSPREFAFEPRSDRQIQYQFDNLARVSSRYCDLKTCRTELESYRREPDEARRRTLVVSKRRLDSELETTKLSLVSCKRELAEERRGAEEMRKRLLQTAKELDSVKIELDIERRTVDSTKAKLKKAKEYSDELKEECRRELEAVRREPVEARRRTLTPSKRQVASELRTTKACFVPCKDELVEELRDAEQMRKFLKLTADSFKMELAIERNTVDCTKSKLKKLTEHCEELREELANAESRVQPVTDDYFRLESDLAKTKQRLERERTELSKTRERLVRFTGGKDMDFPNLAQIVAEFNDVRSQHIHNVRRAAAPLLADARLLQVVGGCKLTANKALWKLLWTTLHCVFARIKVHLDDKIFLPVWFTFQLQYDKLLKNLQPSLFASVKKDVNEELRKYELIPFAVFECFWKDPSTNAALNTFLNACIGSLWLVCLNREPSLKLWPAAEHFDAALFDDFSDVKPEGVFQKLRGSKRGAPLAYFCWPSLFEVATGSSLPVTPVICFFRFEIDFNHVSKSTTVAKASVVEAKTERT